MAFPRLVRPHIGGIARPDQRIRIGWPPKWTNTPERLSAARPPARRTCMSSPAAQAPLLFFDSGLGGLTVLGPTRALLPTAPIVYAAAYAGLPYGQKRDEELAARVPALLGRLVERSEEHTSELQSLMRISYAVF